MKLVDAGAIRLRAWQAAWLLKFAWAGLVLSLAWGLWFTAIAGGANPPGMASTVAAPGNTAAASPLDEPLRLVADAAQVYRGVQDYTCLFIKHERLRGQLQAENVIDMRARTQPFSVYLHWLAPQQFTGQEACYVTGRNNGMMRVHSTGLLGIAGFVSLDPRDPRAAQNSR